MPSFDSNIGTQVINPWTEFYDSGKNSLAINALQQAQTDRATLRGLAPGLATRNPGAVAGASVLPGGSEAINSLSGMDTAQAQIAAERAKLLMLQPDLSSPPVPGPQAPAGSPAPTDGSTPAGGDLATGNPLLGPLPGYDLAGRPIGISNGTPAPADVTQPPGQDHPALPAVRDFATKIMAVPPEQRPAAYQTLLPWIKKAGAIHAPDQYPGDDAVSHLASGGPLQPTQVAGPGAPTAPASGVQFAGPGAPAASPTFAPTPADLPTMQGQPLTAPAGNETPADVLTRLRSQQPQTLPDENGMPSTVGSGGAFSPAPQTPVSSLGPSSPVAGATPQMPNTLSGPMPQAAPPQPATPAPQSTFMPPASAQPPAGAQQPAPIGLPPAGAVKALNPMTKEPWPGAPPGYAMYQVPGVRGLQPFRDPGQPSKIKSTPVGGFMINTDEVTGQEVSRFPIPDASRSITVQVPGGTQLFQSGKPVGPVIPFSGRPEQESAYKADISRAEGITTTAQANQASMLRLNEMAGIASQLATGPTAEIRAKAAAWLEAAGASPETIKSWTHMPSGSMPQEFVKLSLTTAGAAAKNDVGANNGIQSTQLYMNANPGMALLPDANKRMTNMIRVAAQFPQDYAQGALQHFGTNEATFLQGGNYAPLTTYNRAWLAQNNPQVGAAAMGILNGDKFEDWSAKLSNPKEYFRAAQMAARIDPKVMVPGRGGGSKPVSDILGHPDAQ
jgi:hypothetical protein